MNIKTTKLPVETASKMVLNNRGFVLLSLIFSTIFLGNDLEGNEIEDRCAISRINHAVAFVYSTENNKSGKNTKSVRPSL